MAEGTKGKWSIYQEEIVMKCGHTKKVKLGVRKIWDWLQTKEKQMNQLGRKEQNYYRTKAILLLRH